MSLRDRTLFVTGASRGIGLAIALRAARDGANVIVAAKTAEPHPKLPGTIHTAARAIEEAGGRVTGLKGQGIRYGAPGAPQRMGLLATNGRLHDEALARLREVF